MKDLFATFGLRWFYIGAGVALIAVAAGIAYETWQIRRDRDQP